MSFVGEINRRKVFQVVAVYAVVAWLLIQIVDVINEPLGLPNWFDTAVIVALAIGFPIAVILAWAFDLTPEGVVKDQGTVQSGGRRIEYVLIGLLVIAVGTLLYREFTPPEQQVEVVAEEFQREVLPNSVAVLPFENLTVDSEYAFFAPGVHDTILKELAKIRDLNVIARTSVLQYADGLTSIEQIAEDLRVETVMEGSVQYAEGRVLVTAQLIDPNTNTHLWSESYDRELEGIFEIQADIATQIATALEAELLPNERQSIETPLTDSPEAYALYVRAVEDSFQNQNASFEGQEPLLAALADLDRATTLDPDFALAYAQKAYISLTFYSGNNDVVRAYANRALELDPTIGLAQMVLGRLHQAEWNEAEALRAYQQAEALSPNDPVVLQNFGIFHSFLGRHDEALRLVRRATELDPDNDNSYRWEGIAFRFAMDNEAATVAYETTIALDPLEPTARFQLGFCYLSSGNLDAAVEQFRLAEELFPDEAVGISSLAYMYRMAGMPEDATRLFQRWERAEELYALAYPAPRINAYLAIENEERALSEFRRFADDRVLWFVGEMFLKFNTWNDPILDQPEFVEVRSRLGFRE